MKPAATSSEAPPTEDFQAIVQRSVDNPNTYMARLRLLRLEQYWSTTSDDQKERVLASVIGQLSEAELRSQAPNIAALYGQLHLHQQDPPKQLLQLRIDLRQKNQEDEHETLTGVEQVNSSQEQSDTGGQQEAAATAVVPDKERETKPAAAPKTTQTRPGKKGARRRPTLTQQAIGKLSKVPRRTRPAVGERAEQGMQTLGRRRCCARGTPQRARPTLDVLEEESGDENALQHDGLRSTHTQTGGRRRERVEYRNATILLPEEATVQEWLQKMRQDRQGREQEEARTARPRSPSLEMNSEDERQTERWAMRQIQEQYELMVQEERAEENFAAQYQEELEVEAALEQEERAEVEALRGTLLDAEPGDASNSDSS